MANKGAIYILTNPSFPEYVKIGYADDVKARLKQLNNSECIPFAFRIYATYEVDSRLSDLQVHKIIDRLNPSLRSIENFEGKKRVREFYAMNPDDAYDLLEAMAEIHGCTSKLHRHKLSKTEAEAESIAEEIDTEHKEKAENFSFTKCQIPIGAQLEFCNAGAAGIYCTVVDDRMVEYEGKRMYLTGLAKLLVGKNTGIAGPRYFKYNGEWLNDIRHRMGF